MNDIIQVMKAMIKILEMRSPFWTKKIKILLNRIEGSYSKETRMRAVKEVTNIYGGMGSFSDFIVMNGKDVDSENNKKIRELRSELWEKCEEILNQEK